MTARGQIARRKGSRGFALLLTVTLLSFIVLLLLSLSIVTRAETLGATTQQQLAQARQYARLGLTVAIGQLQRCAGPDQRNTTRASFLPAVVANKTQWTGVWSGSAPSQTWLVSSPPRTLADPTAAFGSPVVLVGANTADVSNPATGDPDQVQVDAVNITVRAADFPGWTAAADPIVGRYAYWVGDEGVKLSVCVQDGRSMITGDGGPNPWVRPDPGPLWGGFDFLNPANQASIGQVLAYGQLGYVDSTAFSTTRLKQNYHRCTVTALGVPANAHSGGLKLDGSTDAPNPYIGATGPHFDATFFSANPPAGTIPDLLPTARFAVRHRGSTVPPANALSGPSAPANLLVAGAFNVNSIDPLATSQRDRWRAILAAAATLHFPAGVIRTLTAAELDALAGQVTATALRAASPAASKNLNEPFRGVDDFARASIIKNAIDAAGINADRTPLSPDYVRQEDILALLAPILFARSDTFVIRAYGEVRNPRSALVVGQAWCEAVVQRVADFVDPTDAPGSPPSTPDNQVYGRRFLVVGFRWLTAADI